MQTIKRISLDDYNKLAIVFSEADLIRYGIVENDKIDLSDCLLIDGGKDETKRED